MRRYSSLGSFLHWLIAIVFFVLLFSGWSLYFEIWPSKQFVFELFQWHKSIGILALFLVCVRVFWRIKTKSPELPIELKHQQHRVLTGHFLIYVLIIVMPISGWMLVSTDPKGIPTLFFGLFEWLDLPLSRFVYKPSTWLHFYAAIVLSFVVIGHVSMAVRHHLQGVFIFERILPSRSVKAAILATLIVVAALSSFVFLSFNSSGSNGLNANIVEAEKEHLAFSNEISFSGKHAGNLFTGTFSEWSLKTDIDFDKQTMRYFDLEVSINSVKTGSSLNDKTLLEYDWFNVAEFPIATFTSNKAEFLDANRVKIIGQFKIKDIVKPLQLIVIYQNSVLNTEFTIKRSDYKLGQEADADAEWVSEEINIKAKAEVDM